MALTRLATVMYLTFCFDLPPLATCDNERQDYHGVHPTSPCLYQEDQTYGGLLVDCRFQRLSSIPPPSWIPTNTTTLFLQHNSIKQLDDRSLQGATQLRLLSLAKNNVTSIHQHAFRFNTKLRILDLEGNNIRLDTQTIKEPLFYSLHSLEVLKLLRNNNDQLYDSSYPQYLLRGLINLQTLTLDTFRNDLHFNGIFENTTKLTALHLGGGLTAIRNETFQSFDSIHLKNLTISNTKHFKYTETGSLRFFKCLDSYMLYYTHQGTLPTLESLAPFVDRNLTTLHLQGLNIDRHYLDHFREDFAITPYNTRYLLQICVKHFSLKHNYLFFLESGALNSPTWYRCLVSLDVSMNPLMGDLRVLARLAANSKSLVAFRLLDRKYSFLMGKFDEQKMIVNTHYKIPFNDKRSLQKIHTQCPSGNETSPELISGFSDSRLNLNRTIVKFAQDTLTWTFFLPKTFLYFNINGLSVRFGGFNVKARFINGGHLEEAYLANCGIRKFTGTFVGLDNLKTLDISHNDGSIFNSSFLDSFPKLTRLNMSKMNLDQHFKSNTHDPIFLNLYNLEYLDLSHNNIYHLPSDIFSSNNRLKSLNLDGNRFVELPLKLDQFPDLDVFDIRQNSFHKLSQDEIISLENHARTNPEFSLFLDGNVFSCTCYSIRFLKWLQTTRMKLDGHKNYTCTLDNGELSTTKQISSVQGFWRGCQGEDAFYTSLILLSLTVLGYPLFFLGVRFKTQITAACYQYFSSKFAFKTPGDYPLGVYIGYSIQDSDFACLALKNFVQDQLHLTTYISDHDLLPGSNEAESIVSAINSSWRILLVVTEDYLQDCWSYLAMKTAMYAVGPSNPGRLVMIILSYDNDLQRPAVENQIPHYILQDIHEDNIIKVTYDRHDIQATFPGQDDLRDALLG